MKKNSSPPLTAAVTVGVNQVMMQASQTISNVSIATPAEPIMTLTYRPKVKS